MIVSGSKYRRGMRLAGKPVFSKWMTHLSLFMMDTMIIIHEK